MVNIGDEQSLVIRLGIVRIGTWVKPQVWFWFRWSDRSGQGLNGFREEGSLFADLVNR